MAIGFALLCAPVAFEATAGIELPPDPSLLSEVRAQGGALLALSALVLLGAYVRSLTATSTLIAAVLYLSYGTSRVLGMLLDGPPSTSLFVATGLELVLGVACACALLLASPAGRR